MKKFISLLLALVMELSLVACGNNADTNNDPATDEQPPRRDRGADSVRRRLPDRIPDRYRRKVHG